MKNEFEFNTDTYNLILEKIYFTEFEKRIMELKRKQANTWSNSRVAMELNISERQLYRYYEKITNKIIKYFETL